jgi:hypothetical protein
MGRASPGTSNRRIAGCGKRGASSRRFLRRSGGDGYKSMRFCRGSLMVIKLLCVLQVILITGVAIGWAPFMRVFRRYAHTWGRIRSVQFHSLHSASACTTTTAVAFSCLSGGGRVKGSERVEVPLAFRERAYRLRIALTLGCPRNPAPGGGRIRRQF